MCLDYRPVIREADDVNGADDHCIPIEEYLTRNYGAGAWVLDPAEDKYIVLDFGHEGPGRGYIVYDRDMRRSSATIVSSRLN